jgi:mono/diheme cytochrome c family protein
MKMKSVAAFHAMVLLSASAFGQATTHQSTVTAVSGESWLHHLHRPFGESSMGKTWYLGPSSNPDIPPPSLASASSSRAVVALRGADLYRLNCQGCHGESGQGAPPEIASLINPIRSTSPALVAQRMQEVGMAMTRREAAEMASQSQAALLNRLHHGGKDMPSFQQLSEPEIASLIAYLKLLAEVPGAAHQQIAIRETPARIGELIAKSTCHTCHDATGANPMPAELSEGTIPPLSVLPERVNQQQLVRKVTMGAPVLDATVSPYRGRMPVFRYLHQNEAADVYAYLKLYPPQAEIEEASTTAPITRAYLPENLIAQPIPDPPPAPDPFASVDPAFLLMGSMSFTFILLTAGGFITIHEFRKFAHQTSSSLSKPNDTLPVTNWGKVEVLLDCPAASLESADSESVNWMEERKIS